LIESAELSGTWDPATDDRISVWEVVLQLAKALNERGAEEAARLMAQAGQRIDLDTAKELAYLLFSICEKRGWTQTALLFNGLGTSWSDLSAAARIGGSLTPPPAQGEFDLSIDEE
jgi:putative DNA methylase